MCAIDAYANNNPSEHDDLSSGGGYTLLSHSTTEKLVLLGVTIYFIGCWLKPLEQNVLECCHMYIFAMQKLFLKSQLNFLNHLSQRENTNPYYMLLELVGM